MNTDQPTHILIHHFSPGNGPQPGTPEHDVEMREWEAIHDELLANGTLIGGYAYQLEGVTLASGNTTQGAIADPTTGEVSFAMHAIAADDDASAEAVARAMPSAKYGRVEIRRLM